MKCINVPNPRNEKLYVDNQENCLHISVLFPISLPYSIEIAFNELVTWFESKKNFFQYAKP